MNTIQCNGRMFDDDSIVSGECYIVRSLLASSLEVETLEFSVYSTDPTVSQFTVDSKVILSHNSQRLKTFFLQSVSRQSKYIYRFESVSAAGVLDKRDYYGGIYTGQTVRDVVADICKNFPVSVASNVAGIKLYGWLPISTRREALAQVLFAISAAFVEDATGSFTISGLSPEQVRVIPESETSQNSSIEYTSPAVDVIVLEHQYTEGPEEITLFEGTTTAGDIITFSEPCHSLVASGFTITEQGANYAIVSSGSGKLTGKKYVHSTREVKGKRTQARDAGQNESKIRVEEATLVSLVNSRAVADRLADYYACSERIISDVSYQADDAGDVLSQYHPYDGDMVQTCIESLDITLSGKLLAKMTSLVGYIPPDISQIEYYDTYEILTGSGTWTAPKGAKNGRAVLIGGGDGGTNGQNGESGGDGHELSRPETEGKGGKGGEPGTPGNGGKILQVEIDAAQSYSYKSGQGGGIGLTGSASTFGSYSSENGTASDGGYTDLISGTTYAKKGLPGVAGGDGGDAENNGSDVEIWKGGIGGEGASKGGVSAKGGGGSGAAKGNDGTDGLNGNIRRTQGNYFPFGGNGARGANAIPAEPQKEYGCGGSAGHGGGGGGGGGAASDNSLGNSGDDGSGGSGGSGSSGTPGNPGCIIVYYSLPRKETA
ncbi:hypothetical protein [Butyricicoccus pullicaecorum]|uniref:Uncharacterized protein n=1 Tax=Butyricicoccus pullicaecorum TaxID=501571 RepID=A0A1Y4LT96_9FIRM|nr:hypothetical protein [Butyricicoccus pullicaecorum]OUP59080.1 hypothetical protein B5F15_06340 [Butyricicoccus pullicaecorum]